MLILSDELGSSLLFKYVHLTLKDYNKFEFNISVTGAGLIGIIRLDVNGYKTNIFVWRKWVSFRNANWSILAFVKNIVARPWRIVTCLQIGNTRFRSIVSLPLLLPYKLSGVTSRQYADFLFVVFDLTINNVPSFVPSCRILGQRTIDVT